jgi:hypothetical protein
MAADANTDGRLIDTIVFADCFRTSSGLSLSSWSDWSPLSSDDDELTGRDRSLFVVVPVDGEN